jgi:hypothetical protein
MRRTTVTVGANPSITREWSDASDESDARLRDVAWRIAFRLATSVVTEDLAPADVRLREILTSLQRLADTARNQVEDAGREAAVPPRDGSPSLFLLTQAYLMDIRMFTLTWDQRLTDWEAQRPAGRTVEEHETIWERRAEFIAARAVLTHALLGHQVLLARYCGAVDLVRQGISLLRAHGATAVLSDVAPPPAQASAATAPAPPPRPPGQRLGPPAVPGVNRYSTGP